ncbi:MAG: cytochrome c oxidase subunit 3 [Candidatus Omnitrophica bacterium]|nr:cytochrome c oxidase subunit 3 [Candidatus Omnitrophota bacterium]
MDAIPYTVKAREDTGLYNARLGIWLFLASEVMLFGALFATYVILRLGALHWPLGASLLSIPLGTFNTVVLISSSVTMVFAWVSLKEKNLGKYKMYMGFTIILAVLFIVVKLFLEYIPKFEHHLYPGKSTFWAIYFTLTGLHALHVLGGIGVNTYFWGPGANMWQSEPERFTNRIEIAGLYWHFVDLVWIFLFPILYLL